jgi:ligand-binding sensor domain-containing protein
VPWKPPAGEDLPRSYIRNLYVARDGSLWIGTTKGLASWKDGKLTQHPDFAGKVVDALVEDRDGTIWAAANGIPSGRLCAIQSGSVQCYGEDGSFKEGQVRRSYAAGDGLGAGSVGGLYLDTDGTLWAATEGVLSRVKEGRVATLTSKNGLPCKAVNWVVGDDEHSFWLYMACGLVRISRSELNGWVSAAEKDKDTKRIVQATVFDNSDGVRSRFYAGGYSPRVAKTTDGRLWFLPWDGLSVVDPRHLPFNKLPPAVHIEQITADRKTYDASSAANGRVSLPALIRAGSTRQ